MDVTISTPLGLRNHPDGSMSRSALENCLLFFVNPLSVNVSPTSLLDIPLSYGNDSLALFGTVAGVPAVENLSHG
jgi:hypothetical protein